MYVPEKYYVGFQSQGQDSLVGFFTPDDGDDKSSKRKQTVDNWSHDKFNATTITNEPRTGFRIVDTARRHRTQNVLFRIIHPEVGAEFEVTAENLNELHQQCIIEYGEIKTELLFVRNGTNNILVVKDSPEHKKALEDMKEEKAKKESIAKIDKKKIVPGSIVDLPSDGKVIYLGKHTVSYIRRKDERGVQYHSSSYEVVGTDDKYLVFLDKTDKSLILRKSWPKIEKLYKETATNLDIDKIVSEVRKVYTGAYDYNYVFHVELDKKLDANDFEITFEENKNCNMQNLSSWKYDEYKYGLLPDGSYYLAYPRHSTYQNVYAVYIKYDEVYKANGLDVKITKNPITGASWVYGRNEITVTDPNTVFYKLKITKKKEQE